MDLFEIVYWDSDYMLILLVKIAIAVALFACLRFFSGAISNTNATKQLAEKDNPAFGISMAGVVFAVTIMLTGTLYGKPEMTVHETLISTGLYGLLGIALMSLSRLIFDDVSMPKFSVRDQILKGNVAAGIIDAGNVIATAIIIRAVMLWVEYNTLAGIKAVLIGYVISQILLSLVSLYRVKLFSWQNKGKSMQTILEKGNTALALRFSGHRIGAALAISAAANILLYELSDFVLLIAGWIIVSIVVLVVLSVLSFLADKIILSQIDVEDEIVRQKNVALGAVQGMIYLSLGFLLAIFIA